MTENKINSFKLRLIKYIMYALTKILNYLNKKYINKHEKIEEANLKIDPSSICNLNNIRFQKGCFLNIGEKTQVVNTLIFEKENASISIGNRVFIKIGRAHV